MTKVATTAENKSAWPRAMRHVAICADEKLTYKNEQCIEILVYVFYSFLVNCAIEVY